MSTEAEGEKPETEPPVDDTRATTEQLLYAKVLAVGMYIGLALLFVTFCLYMFGIVSPAVPLDKVPEYWSGEKGPTKEIVQTPDGPEEREVPAGVQRYIRAINQDYVHAEHPVTGWSWLDCVGKGDFLNFIGIAILAAVTIFCYLAIVPGLVRRKDRVFTILALLEVAVLVFAASGILAVGH